MMISKFRTIIALALQNRPKQSKLVRWLQGRELEKLLGSQEGRAKLVPDAFFTIEDKGDKLHFFLEADRSNMSQDIFLNKMKIYWAWRKNGPPQQKLNVPAFRVLTITETEERKEGLRKITKQAEPSGEGKNKFLFACEDSFSLIKPDSVLSSLWLSPKDNTPHSLIE